MKRTLLGAALILLAGCGGGASKGFAPPPTATSTLAITWGDGNPGDPVCPAPGFVCKSGYTVHDKSTGAVQTVPLNTAEYDAPAPYDTYEVREDGEDQNGAVIHSDYTAVTIASTSN